MIAPKQQRLGIDHPLVTVADHAQTLAYYQRMGFNPSPVSHHPWGTVTSLMMFPNNFIELIGVADASLFGTNAVNGFCFGRQLGAFLARQEEGVSLVALHSQDADADYAVLSAAGLEGQGRIDFRRRMTRPDGRPDEAVVSLGLFIAPALVDAGNFICQQHRPELIWVPEWQNHPNQVVGISGVTYLAEPEVLWPRWQKLYGAKAQMAQDVLRADSGCGLFEAMTQTTFTQRYPQLALPKAAAQRAHAVMLTLTTRSLAATRAVLVANQVPFRTQQGQLFVGPEQTGNVILAFAE